MTERRRRGHNEGSIFQRKDGRWVGVVDFGWEMGKRKRKYIYGRTRAEIQERFTSALRSRQQDVEPVGERETVGRFLDRWLQDRVRATVRPRTFQSYSYLVEKHLGPGLGHIRLAKLGPADVQRFLNVKLSEGLKPRTVQYIHAVLRRAVGQALRWGLVTRNSATLVDSPRVRRAEVQALTAKQTGKLLEQIKGDRLEALFSVAVAIGLRQGEALALQWEDVDLKHGTLRVRYTLQRLGKTVELVEPKSDRGKRSIALPAISVAALRSHRLRQRKERLLAGSSWRKSDFVFTSTIGTPLESRNVTKRLQKILVDAKLPRLRFHDLRHTAASLLLAQGVHPRVVMEILGHSQIKLTMDTYSHVVPSLQRDAAAKIDALLGSA